MKFTRFLLVLTMVAFGIIAFRSYRINVAVSKASEYQPRAVVFRSIPAGTSFEAVLPYGITEATKPGDKIVSFVSAPVVVNNELAIPSGAQLIGTLDKIERSHHTAAVRLSFSQLVIDKQNFKIETNTATANVPVESEIDTVGNAFKVMTGALLGTAMGAGSGDKRAISRGAILGGMSGLPDPNDMAKISVVLTQPIQVHSTSGE